MSSYERYLLPLAAVTLIVAPLCAQSAERRATFTGGGDKDGGKCTIEVYVDGAADVEVRGDRGFLRTISGQPAQWRRFECSGPMPTNASEVRFNGVDGRGRQDLIQEPSSGRGSIVVRIQDPDGGGEGYTFDLVWRGTGIGPDLGSRYSRDRDRWTSSDDAVRACQDAVRDRANQQYGLQDIGFGNRNTDENRRRDNTIMGSFDVRRGNYRDSYRFACTVDVSDSRIRSVDISQEQDAGTAGRYARRDERTSACQRAAEQQIERSGYHNARFDWSDANNRRSESIEGTASAQRGNNGPAYSFEIQCSVDDREGGVRSLRVNRR
jgi:hypothetical protein